MVTHIKKAVCFGDYLTLGPKENIIKKTRVKKGTVLNNLLIIFSHFLCNMKIFNLEENRNSFCMCVPVCACVSACASACVFKEEKNSGKNQKKVSLLLHYYVFEVHTTSYASLRI